MEKRRFDVEKNYIDCMNEIDAEELFKGLLAHGMFAEKLPPIFTSASFYDYCCDYGNTLGKKAHDYVYYETMRNTNVPRQLGIPAPMSYYHMCKTLSENWERICNHFYKNTHNDRHKISRIHIRKLKGKPTLFEMGYDNWQTDGTPEIDLLLGKRFAVHADISTCFPSIYSHALAWALVGKSKAKNEQNISKAWQNKIDAACQIVRNNETHGLIIGPHASNLIAEIILTAIDHKLSQSGWEYVRRIDDYSCYTETMEEAESFLRELTDELRVYDLSINHKKTRVVELPVALTKEWKRQLNAFALVAPYGGTSYKEASSYLDLAVKLMEEHNMDAAVLNYAIKTLSGQRLSHNAKEYCAKQAMHLAIIYPYLTPLMDEFVFQAYSVKKRSIHEFSKILINKADLTGNYEMACYAVFYSIKYGFKISKDLLKKVEEKTTNSILLLLLWLYYKRNDMMEAKERITKKADCLLNNQEFERNWIFVYEVVAEDKLENEWKVIKGRGVSFIKDEYK